ncbi:hypothetical protein [Morganella psychrotolerans]|uniref:hypothetical protein n=1 Tax=Morganella psychrotolerans TaxID=368603 RepID=UPI000944EB9C|nr:hypothetical protein [Morganella psychrotolerans]
MSHALKKTNRLCIPPRDKSNIASPRSAIGHECSHKAQVKNAVDFGFSRYEAAMKELAKV